MDLLRGQLALALYCYLCASRSSFAAGRGGGAALLPASYWLWGELGGAALLCVLSSIPDRGKGDGGSSGGGGGGGGGSGGGSGGGGAPRGLRRLVWGRRARILAVYLLLWSGAFRAARRSAGPPLPGEASQAPRPLGPALGASLRTGLASASDRIRSTPWWLRLRDGHPPQEGRDAGPGDGEEEEEEEEEEEDGGQSDGGRRAEAARKRRAELSGDRDRDRARAQGTEEHERTMQLAIERHGRETSRIEAEAREREEELRRALGRAEEELARWAARGEEWEASQLQLQAKMELEAKVADEANAARWAEDARREEKDTALALREEEHRNGMRVAKAEMEKALRRESDARERESKVLEALERTEQELARRERQTEDGQERKDRDLSQKEAEQREATLLARLEEITALGIEQKEEAKRMYTEATERERRLQEAQERAEEDMTRRMEQGQQREAAAEDRRYAIEVALEQQREGGLRRQAEARKRELELSETLQRAREVVAEQALAAEERNIELQHLRAELERVLKESADSKEEHREAIRNAVLLANEQHREDVFRREAEATEREHGLLMSLRRAEEAAVNKKRRRRPPREGGAERVKDALHQVWSKRMSSGLW